MSDQNSLEFWKEAHEEARLHASLAIAELDRIYSRLGVTGSPQIDAAIAQIEQMYETEARNWLRFENMDATIHQLERFKKRILARVGIENVDTSDEVIEAAIDRLTEQKWGGQWKTELDAAEQQARAANRENVEIRGHLSQWADAFDAVMAALGVGNPETIPERRDQVLAEVDRLQRQIRASVVELDSVRSERTWVRTALGLPQNAEVEKVIAAIEQLEFVRQAEGVDSSKWHVEHVRLASENTELRAGLQHWADAFNVVMQGLGVENAVTIPERLRLVMAAIAGLQRQIREGDRVIGELRSQLPYSDSFCQALCQKLGFNWNPERDLLQQTSEAIGLILVGLDLPQNPDVETIVSHIDRLKLKAERSSSAASHWQNCCESSRGENNQLQANIQELADAVDTIGETVGVDTKD